MTVQTCYKMRKGDDFYLLLELLHLTTEIINRKIVISAGIITIFIRTINEKEAVTEASAFKGRQLAASFLETIFHLLKVISLFWKRSKWGKIKVNLSKMQ